MRFEAYKFYCAHCQHYFNQRFEGINNYQRTIERLRYQVFDQHSKGVSQKELARDIKTGKTTIERWYHHVYELKNQQFKQRLCPTVLEINEHFFNHKQSFATMKYQWSILKILRMREDKLNQQQQQKCDEYLKQRPAIGAIYQFKQRLHQLLLKKHCQARWCKRLLPIFLNKLKQLKQSEFKSLKRANFSFYWWAFNGNLIVATYSNYLSLLRYKFEIDRKKTSSIWLTLQLIFLYTR